jgi:hypothetical protein
MKIQGRRLRLIVGLAVLSAAAVFLVGCGDNGSDDATVESGSASPSVVVERFFHWYVSEKNLGRDPMARASLQANADVSPEFIDLMEPASMGARDPMLCAGEIPHAFTLGKPAVSGSTGRISVVSPDSHGAWEVDLKLDSSAWRIVAITCAVG